MKNLFYGLGVAVVALSASAFTNVESKSLVEPYLVQVEAGKFESRTDKPNSIGCQTGATLHCYYMQVPNTTLPAPANATSYTDTEITTLLDNDIIVAGDSSSPGVYVAP